ncbi:c-type cytochrome [Telluribacter sp.]|jgi:cytochrome c551/c552|uniref:c-type cytochrome n=1 Tax=Telluribacter sp. TaxID=1978767 RepID=UPI002E12054D|nr:c-type cytochrome [Telluribacter sp.]
MTLKKLTPLAALALAGSLWLGCSSKEDQDKYDKFYGNGRQEREASASADMKKIDPDTINSLSVTDNADTQVGGASDEQFDSDVEVGGKTEANVTKNTTDANTAAAATNNRPAAANGTPAATQPAQPQAAAQNQRKEVPADVAALLNKHTCTACHRPYEKLVGPAFSDVAKRKYPNDRIVKLVHAPEPANWPDYPPMMALPNVPKDDIVKIATWINSLN